ncbi:MAG: helix-turn-helix domain-containing protein [Ruminococcus sp.]
MLTNFGKALRKMRIDHSEFLKDMAAKLNVTVAYLSAVENGKREVPDGWVEQLIDQYCLNEEEGKELQEYAYEGKDSLKISLVGIEQEEKDLALAFARSFKDLSEADKAAMKKIFGEKMGVK